MCHTASRGGLRCASYARVVLTAAETTLAAASEAADTAHRDPVDRAGSLDAAERVWLDAATQYAATPAGRHDLSTRLDAAVRVVTDPGTPATVAGEFAARAARLTDALRRGEVLAAVARETVRRLNPGTEPQPAPDCGRVDVTVTAATGPTPPLPFLISLLT